MISSEVQRTLVKSPPELWTELSDPESLARHLGELGDIRITHVEPEQLVEWEAEGATGKVHLKASGWGTKVTLSVSRELPALEPSESADITAAEEATNASEASEADVAAPEIAELGGAEPQVEPAAPQAEAAEPVAEAPEPQAEQPGAAQATDMPASMPDLSGWSAQSSNLPDIPTAVDAPPPTPDPAPGPEAETEPESQPRRGFFARLFGGRRRTTPVPEQQIEGDVEQLTSPVGSLAAQAIHASSTPSSASDCVETPNEPEPLSPDPTTEAIVPADSGDEQALLAVAESGPERQVEQPAEEIEPVEPSEALASELQAPDLAAELLAAEETAAEEVRAMLVAVLDRLGAAHHRPFSRS